MFDNLISGESVIPAAVVGPYGAGKTQYLYEAFRRAWANDIPAVYVDLKTILREFEEAEVEAEPVEWLKERILSEATAMAENGDTTWHPDFRISEEKREFFEDYVSTDALENEKRVLLVDEVEQKYTDFEETVDDSNPLRDILDGLSDTLQIWSFGLVSAYELLGEADRRRFQEIRIPIADVDTVWSQLAEGGKPQDVANGVWWLARGRPGWITKHSQNLPSVNTWDKEKFTKWVRQSGEQRYYGADAIVPVWDEVPAEQIYDAKRTVLLSDPAYEPWTTRSPNVISVEDARRVLLDTIRDETEVSPEVFEILDTNLQKVLEGLSPPSNWVVDDSGEVEKMFLPANAFARENQMQGLIQTVSDFISSFEKRGDVRQNVIRILNDINTESLASTWGGLLEPLQKGDEYDIEPWTVEPEIAQEAYPPLALNPERLSDANTADLRENLTEPIEFESEVSLNGATISVRLCPTETSFDLAMDSIENHADLSEMMVIVVPDIKEADDWSSPEYARRLEELDLLTISKVGGDRIWDMVLHLNHRIQQNEYDSDFGRELINQTISPEIERDQERNTIRTLFEELDRLIKGVTREARSNYKHSYSLDEADGLIWQDERLDTTNPFYGKSSGGDTPKLGIEYGLLFSEKSYNDGVEYAELVGGLLEAYDNEYLDQESLGSQPRFRFAYFLRRAFKSDGAGLTEYAEAPRRRYTTETGELKPAVRRTQSALGYLSVLNDGSGKELYQKLSSLETSIENVSVLSEFSSGQTQATEFLWGLLLDWTLRDNIDLLLDDLSETQDEIDYLNDRLDEIKEQLVFFNDRLNPPTSLDREETLEIRTDQLEKYLTNLRTVSDGFQQLIKTVREFQNFAASAIPLWKATERYEILMRQLVKHLQQTVGGVELYTNISDLKSEYNSLRSWCNSTDSLNNTSVPKGELSTTIREFGDYIFDFSKRVEKSEIPVERIDLIEELDGIIEDDIRQIKRLNSQIETIDSLASDVEEVSDDVVQSILDFADKTATTEVADE